MKKLNIIIALLLSLTACNDWLDVELDNTVDDNKLFSSPTGFKEALAGVYSQMSKGEMYGRALTMEYLDLCAQYYKYDGVAYDYKDWKVYDYSNAKVKGNISSLWNNFYTNIAQLNCILLWLDRNSEVLTVEEENQFRGEALGLRAYLHFDLYRLFCPDYKRNPQADGIPYNKQFGVALPPMYSVEQVLQLVVNDLLEAEKCLAADPIIDVVPYTFTTPVEGSSDVVDAAAKDKADKYIARMNLFAVKAVLARVYQARGEYTKAIGKAQEVIESGKFRLLDFSSVDKDEKSIDVLFSDEHIFSLRNRNLRNYSSLLHLDVNEDGIISHADLPLDNHVAIYESNNDDVRLTKWFNMDNFVKFIPDSTNFYPTKMPMIKLSEMYLLISECSYFKDKSMSLEYINELRDHRIRGNQHWGTLRQSYIFDEMKREYIGEGQLWYVYKRNNLNLVGHGPSGGTIEASDGIYVFPFPDREIEDGHRNQRK